MRPSLAATRNDNAIFEIAGFGRSGGFGISNQPSLFVVSKFRRTDSKVAQSVYVLFPSSVISSRIPGQRSSFKSRDISSGPGA